MKKRNLVLGMLLIMFLAMSTSIMATDYVVSGAGNTDVNGIFYETAELHNDKPTYQSDNECWLYWGLASYGATGWVIDYTKGYSTWLSDRLYFHNHIDITGRYEKGAGDIPAPLVSEDGASQSTEVQIGEGTDIDKHIPIYSYYGYTYSQTIYNATDFGIPSVNSITKISYNYHWEANGNNTCDDWIIYLSTTSDTDLDGGFLNIGTFTQVFDGDVDMELLENGDGWLEITLDTPFTYNPQTDGNLVVAVDENTPGYINNANDYFYCDLNESSNVSIVAFSDSPNPDPNSPPTGTLTQSYPNTKFLFDEDAPLPVTLSSFYALYSSETLTINWATECEENNFGWNIYRGNSEDALENELTIKINSQIIEGAGTTTSITEYEYTDEHFVLGGETYWYWLEDVSISGVTEIHGPATISIPIGAIPQIPEAYGLQQNYPNPFNPSTSISFALQEAGKCKIEIYDIKGRKVITLFDEKAESDIEYQLIWNGKDDNGKAVSSGIYFYKMKSGRYVSTKKMIMMK